MKLSALTASVLTVTSIILSAGIASAQTDTNRKPVAEAAINTAINSEVIGSSTTNANSLKPFNLVYLAYQGNLKAQGIPSGSTLIFENQIGTLNAKDLVKAAVNANKLPSQILQDKTYISAVDVQLTSLQRNFLR
ncbi:hypothetical protein H6G76_09580 [Nostoc sp. FACHB-152]|uniref:hypothetical protein n=1 Tax=unclassified Nostoc TaxID=2593658 RepID=UPI00168302A0|nr:MULTISPECIES: hypothetical protein [unclassified Nostoc]MBD2447416.1 hypothetical protein [Nostoc sp. FACHB-152]MBD2468226.1 hypothetical protein [Nostoc sp. FACHB-145]